MNPVAAPEILLPSARGLCDGGGDLPL